MKFDQETGRIIVPLQPLQKIEITPITRSTLTKKAKEFELHWDKDKYNQGVKELNDFQKVFPKGKIKDITLEEYNYINTNSFCRWLEDKTANVALMFGMGFNRGYGVWSSKKGTDINFRITEGKSDKEVDKKEAQKRFLEVKEDILYVMNKAEDGKWREVEETRFPYHQIRTKIIYLYFSEKIIPIMSKDYLGKIFKHLDIKFDSENSIACNNELLTMLRGIEEFKEWHTIKIMQFLLWIFPELKNEKSANTDDGTIKLTDAGKMEEL